DLALAPATEPGVDLAVRLDQRLEERVLVERLALHRVFESREIPPQSLPLARGELPIHRVLVPLDDRLRRLEQRARLRERRTEVAGEPFAKRRMGVIRERKMVPYRPERHLEEGEGDDTEWDRLIADALLDETEDAAVIDAARRAEGPDEDAGEGERREDEPDRPVDRAKHALRGGQGLPAGRRGR